jgi:haloacetate dehalogenase
MEILGFSRFGVAGHDRGGRVAYRMALDHPDVVTRLAVLDIVPTIETWERADRGWMLDYWHWAFLAQPEPLPERRARVHFGVTLRITLGLSLQ